MVAMMEVVVQAAAAAASSVGRTATWPETAPTHLQAAASPYLNPLCATTVGMRATMRASVPSRGHHLHTARVGVTGGRGVGRVGQVVVVVVAASTVVRRATWLGTAQHQGAWEVVVVAEGHPCVAAGHPSHPTGV